MQEWCRRVDATPCRERGALANSVRGLWGHLGQGVSCLASPLSACSFSLAFLEASTIPLSVFGT